MMTFEYPPSPVKSRKFIVVVSVVAFHAIALWILQTGLLRRTVELIVPAQILIELTEPAPQRPKPQMEPPSPSAEPKPLNKLPRSSDIPQPPAAPDAAPSPSPSPFAPVSIVEAPASAVVAPSAPAATELGAPSPPPAAPPVALAAPPQIQLPSSDADYLQNPKPPYPVLSKKLNEQGTVILRVLIGVDGVAQRAEIRKSSGFDRLDQAAAATVMKWRYVPGKRAGIAEAMWFNVPISFVLE